MLLVQQRVAFEHCTWRGKLSVAQRIGSNNLWLQFNCVAGGGGQPKGSGKRGKAQR